MLQYLICGVYTIPKGMVMAQFQVCISIAATNLQVANCIVLLYMALCNVG